MSTIFFDEAECLELPVPKPIPGKRKPDDVLHGSPPQTTADSTSEAKKAKTIQHGPALKRNTTKLENISFANCDQSYFADELDCKEPEDNVPSNQDKRKRLLEAADDIEVKSEQTAEKSAENNVKDEESPKKKIKIPQAVADEQNERSSDVMMYFNIGKCIY